MSKYHHFRMPKNLRQKKKKKKEASGNSERERERERERGDLGIWVHDNCHIIFKIFYN